MRVHVSFIRMSFSESTEPVEIEIGEWFTGNGYRFNVVETGYRIETEFGLSGNPTGRYRIMPATA